MKSAVKAAFSKRPFTSLVCWHVSRSRPAVALTFDDGPTEHTPKVLAILKDFKVSPTFFILGNQVEKSPDIAEAVLRSGHEIGNHGFNHEKHDQKELRLQVLQCREILARYGVQTRLYRPPGGALHPGTLLWLWRKRFTTVLWSFDALDSMRHESKWRGADPDFSAVRGGDIILMHDDNPVCVRDLPVMLEAVLKKGLRIVAVSSLIRSSD
jgi:peptidoglycan/xylan/chitin deacetylase (PgdA/CDA1 family)